MRNVVDDIITPTAIGREFGYVFCFVLLDDLFAVYQRYIQPRPESPRPFRYICLEREETLGRLLLLQPLVPPCLQGSAH